MAKARAIVKRRKAVRNTRKITKTMQMIATAKFQKSLKRAVGTKPFTYKIREMVADLVEAVGEFKHPLIEAADRPNANRVAVLVLVGNRGLAGAYNGNVLRLTERFLKQQESEGNAVELDTAGKKAFSYFTFLKRPISHRYDQVIETTAYPDVQELADRFMKAYADGEVDAVYVVYMNFISTGVQKPDVLKLLPLTGVTSAAQHLALQGKESEAAHAKVGDRPAAAHEVAKIEARQAARGEMMQTLPDELLRDDQLVYEFSPSAKELLDELLPITVRTTLFQCFLDASTSENVARMVAMKAATDNADKMIKSLTMQYNRARQSQITTELSEIMGGVEAMKS
jgi:F-type H+-transporting ATPase subunit gamma